MLDAYTVRKAIPRIVVAVIGINLSIYLCIALIDITNVVGGGMATLLTAPFNVAGLNTFGIPTDKSNGIIAGVGAVVGGKVVGAAVLTFISSVGGAGVAAGSLVVLQGLAALFWLLLPILLLVVAILGVVIIRQALLVFLTIVSPVAIALWVLPGTEKYFKKWFDLFVKTLMVYPIIAIVFAMSDIFAFIIFNNNGGGLIGVARIITGLIVIFAPLFMIPFAFRLAGGAIAGLAKVAGGFTDKASQSGFVKNRSDFYKGRYSDSQTRAREQAYDRFNDRASRGGKLNRFANRRVAGALQGYRGDVKDRVAELTKRETDRAQLVSGNADDSIMRAHTVDRKSADTDWNSKSPKFLDSDGNTVSANGLRRQKKDGTIQYRDAGGAWQNMESVIQAEKTFGPRNMSALQQNMAYVMRKANTQEEQDMVTNSFGRLAEGYSMSSNEANGIWKGAGFANQDHNPQWKHASWTKDEETGQFSMKQNGLGLIREVDEKKGNFEAGRYHGDSWATMHEASIEADRRLEADRLLPVGHKDKLTDPQRQEALETIERAARIGHNLEQGYSETDPETKEVVTRTSGRSAIGQGAAPRTAEEMRGFHATATSLGAKYGFDKNQYGTSVIRSDDPTRTPTSRTNDPTQSLDDRNR